MITVESLNNIAAGISRFLEHRPDLAEAYLKTKDAPYPLYIKAAQDIFIAMDGENWISEEDFDIGLFCEAVGIAVKAGS